MARIVRRLCSLALLTALGCQSPYHADRGALLGGLGGAGVGALVGHATGNTAAGAAIGAGVGALSGAAIGAGMDEVEAQNRALIEAKLQRPIGPNAATLDDVIAMSRAGVTEDVIITHIRTHGCVRQLQASDIIMLQQQGVSPAVIKAMQELPGQPQQTVVVQQAPPPPVIIREYRDPYWYGPYYGPHYYHGYYGRPSIGVGMTFR
jgi:Glycine zipper